MNDFINQFDFSPETLPIFDWASRKEDVDYMGHSYDVYGVANFVVNTDEGEILISGKTAVESEKYAKMAGFEITSKTVSAQLIIEVKSHYRFKREHNGIRHKETISETHKIIYPLK